MSRLKNLKLIYIEVPLNKTFSGSYYHITKRVTIITCLETDDGLVSEIYNGDNRSDSQKVIKIIAEEIWPVIRGKEIFESQAIWEEMLIRVSLNHHEDHNLAMEAIACADSAIWDLRGKATGRNVSSLMGGCKQELPVVAICGYYEKGKTLADIEKEADWIINTLGFTALKFKIGGLAPEEDLQRLIAARRGAPHAPIAIDANRGWDYNQLLWFVQHAEQYNICWFEEPFHWYDDINGMARIRDKTKIPICAGQSEISGHGVKRLLEAKAVDIVNFDASEGGGPTEWQRVAGMCKFYGVQMTHHEEPQISLQMLTSIPHGFMVEFFPDPERDPIWNKMVLNKPSIVGGTMSVITEPGFGLQLDWDFIKKYQVVTIDL